jgi:hypothetical protein
MSMWKKGEVTIPVTVIDATFEPKDVSSTTNLKLDLETPTVCVCISTASDRSGLGAHEFGCDKDYETCEVDQVFVADGFKGDIELDLSIPIARPDKDNKFTWTNEDAIKQQWSSRMASSFPFVLKERALGKHAIEVNSPISHSDFDNAFPNGLELEMTATVKDSDCDNTNRYYANKNAECEVSGAVKILSYDSKRDYELYAVVEVDSSVDVKTAVADKLAKNNIAVYPKLEQNTVDTLVLGRRAADKETYIVAISGYSKPGDFFSGSEFTACNSIGEINGLDIVKEACSAAFGYVKNPGAYATCTDEEKQGSALAQCKMDDWNARDSVGKSMIIPNFQELSDAVVALIIRTFIGEIKHGDERINLWNKLETASTQNDATGQQVLLALLFPGVFEQVDCEGSLCFAVPTEAPAKSASSSEGEESATWVPAVVVVCVVAVLVVGALFYMKQQKEYQLQKELQDSMGAGRYGEENYEAMDEELIRGKYNKAHPWYRPSMSRQDATEHLIGLSEGCFLVREATRFDGLILGVKTHNDVLHIKIHSTEDDCLQLEDLKNNDEKTYTAAQTKQPKFGDCVMLINYYAEPHEGVPFVLKFGNDSYDNSRLLYGQTQETPYVPAKRFPASPGAPPVPPKETTEIGNPLYDNVEATQQVYNTRSVFNSTYAGGDTGKVNYDDLPASSGAPVYDDGSGVYSASEPALGSEASYALVGGPEPVYDDGSVGKSSAL